MTPHEKAIHAVNRRLERLQTNLREATVESVRQFLFQSISGTLGLAEALNDYVKEVGAYARRRHADLKQTNDTLAVRHADMLKSGTALLDQFKADPTNRALRQEIERTQQAMAGIQKTLRRGANALQRDVAPSVAMIDKLAECVRRLCEAAESDALKRAIKTVVANVRELYADHPSLPLRNIVDASAWERSAVAELQQAAGFDDAYARTSYQAILALELMTLAVGENPPQNSEEATTRATQRVAERLQAITARLIGDPNGARDAEA